MVDCILEQEKAIQRVLSEDRKASHLVLTWQDVDVLTSSHKALEPFADFTDALSGDSYVTISSIKPTLLFIKHATTATDNYTSIITDLKANIWADFEKRYMSNVTQALQNAAKWLDPRHKTAYLTEEECLIATTKIKEAMMMTLENEQGQQACASTEEGHQHQTINVDEGDNDLPAPKKRKKSLAKLLGQIKKNPMQPHLMQQLQLLGSTVRYHLTSLRLELSWTQIISNGGVCMLLDFHHWENLHASICGTSSASERLFSVAGKIVMAKRSLLKPDKVNKLVFLAKNL